MRYESILTTLRFKKLRIAQLLAPVDLLYNKFAEGKENPDPVKAASWITGQLRKRATGNVSYSELHSRIMQFVNNKN